MVIRPDEIYKNEEFVFITREVKEMHAKGIYMNID